MGKSETPGHTRGGRECKWGRPEGRPHSHQRVALPKKVLGAQCLCRWSADPKTCFPRALSPALAPASGSVRWRLGSEDPRPPSGGSETGSCLPLTAGAAVPAEAEVPCLASDRVDPANGGIAFAFFSSNRPASNRSSHHAGLKDRADSCRHPDPKQNLLIFQSVRAFRSELFRPVSMT